MADKKTNSSQSEEPTSRPKNPQKLRNKNQPKNSDGVITLGKNPRTKIYATKSLKIHNKIIFNNLNSFQMIGFNIATITGALLRHKAYESVSVFESYVEALITNVGESIINELKETSKYLEQYSDEGYKFVIESVPSTSEIKLLNASSNLLINLFMQLDALITNFNYLEKCNHFSSSEKIIFERQWAKIPKEINSKILSLTSTIENKFDIKVKKNSVKSQNEQIDVNKIKSLFNRYKSEKGNIDIHQFKMIPAMKTGLDYMKSF